jgi:hypothetical protein
MKDEDRYHTILGSGLGPWLISDRPRGWEWESFARRVTLAPRYRQRPLLPWRSKLIEEKPMPHDEGLGGQKKAPEERAGA